MGTFGPRKPQPPPQKIPLGQQVEFAGQQRQRIHQALTGADPNLPDMNVSDLVGATAYNLNRPSAAIRTRPMQPTAGMLQSPAPLPQLAATVPMPAPQPAPMTPIQQQVQYAGGTQQAIDDAMNAPGVTIAELVRRIANRPKF